ncbi:UNKNOWN [Stylonychia lemnae]|uniref:Uncharacterized protein n=1 Tax=Stylonychia lemnae TaxID=5949 RepID=A0A077ZSB3_STYLE|nr:UNKNOWN [Stylonychia lemnae]|eukprot:CDW72255.1 UNKNOWN [Stylonychia lemnae]
MSAIQEEELLSQSSQDRLNTLVRADNILFRYPEREFTQDFEKGFTIRHHQPLIKNCISDIKSRVEALNVKSDRRESQQNKTYQSQRSIIVVDEELDEALQKFERRTNIKPNSKVLHLQTSIDSRIKECIPVDEKLAPLEERLYQQSSNVIKRQNVASMKEFLLNRRKRRQQSFQNRAQHYQSQINSSQNQSTLNNKSNNNNNNSSSVITTSNYNSVIELNIGSNPDQTGSRSPLRLKINESSQNLIKVKASGLDSQILRNAIVNRDSLNQSNEINSHALSGSQTSNPNLLKKILNRLQEVQLFNDFSKSPSQSPQNRKKSIFNMGNTSDGTFITFLPATIQNHNSINQTTSPKSQIHKFQLTSQNEKFGNFSGVSNSQVLNMNLSNKLKISEFNPYQDLKSSKSSTPRHYLLDKISKNIKQTARLRDNLNHNMQKINEDINKSIHQNSNSLNSRQIGKNNELLQLSPKIRISLGQKLRSSIIKAKQGVNFNSTVNQLKNQQY